MEATIQCNSITEICNMAFQTSTLLYQLINRKSKQKISKDKKDHNNLFSQLESTAQTQENVHYFQVYMNNDQERPYTGPEDKLLHI